MSKTDENDERIEGREGKNTVKERWRWHSYYRAWFIIVRNAVSIAIIDDIQAISKDFLKKFCLLSLSFSLSFSLFGYSTFRTLSSNRTIDSYLEAHSLKLVEQFLITIAER